MGKFNERGSTCPYVNKRDKGKSPLDLAIAEKNSHARGERQPQEGKEVR